MIKVQHLFSKDSIVHRLVSDAFIQCFQFTFELEPFTDDPYFSMDPVLDFMRYTPTERFIRGTGIHQWQAEEMATYLKPMYQALRDPHKLFTFSPFAEFILDTVIRTLTEAQGYDTWLSVGTWEQRQELYEDACKISEDVLSGMMADEPNKTFFTYEEHAEMLTDSLLRIGELKRGTAAGKLIYRTPETEEITSWDFRENQHISNVSENLYIDEEGID